MLTFINLICILFTVLFINDISHSSSFDNDCVPSHTNGPSAGEAQVRCYERWVEGNSEGLNNLWVRNVLIRPGNDSVLSFRMSRNFYFFDPEWDFFSEEVRNLTMWLDEHNRVSLAIANLIIVRKMDLHTDYDVMEMKTLCAQSTDSYYVGYVVIDFNYHEYFQFGTIYKYWQYLVVSYRI